MSEQASDGGTWPLYDTVIRGGEVIDPGTETIGRYDVAIRDGHIAAVQPDIPAEQAQRVIDATGKIVTPGLIDLHTHIYWGATYWGIEPDPAAARTGVTTWLDVGSAGGYNFPGLREYIAMPAKARVYALLNLSSIGLVAPTWELANPDYWNLDLAEGVVERNRDLILGIKVRIDGRTCRGVGIQPMIEARALADQVHLPLMAHLGEGPPSLLEMLPHFRPGDILTHCFTWQNARIADEQGKVRPEIVQLQKDGLILDVGHGGGSFEYDLAEAMLEQGVVPDVISSDIHQTAQQGPMFDLPTTLSKFLNLGMSLPDVIARATINPARAVDLDHVGTLGLGCVADVAIFSVQEGDFAFYDVLMKERRGSKLLVNDLTMVGGEVLARTPERPPHFWARRAEIQLPAQKPGEPVRVSIVDDPEADVLGEPDGRPSDDQRGQTS